MISKKKLNFGFTLVEMLVVVAIISIAGVLILTIFTRTLRGTNKSQIISAIKQNGQSVLETMDKTIRNSDNVVCVSTPNSRSGLNTTLIVVKNGIYTRYRFIASSSIINGFIQQDNPVKIIDSTTGQQETTTAFKNRICTDNDPMLANAIILTDTNSQTGVSVNNGSFVINKSAGFKDEVSVKFDLNAGINAPQAVAGQIDPINFQTTIQLR